MSDVIYFNIPAIMESCADLQAEIAMINLIMAGMRSAMLKATVTGHFEEYKLDTGQTKNEVRYRSIGELELAYEKMMRLRGMLYTDLNANRQGRITRMVDGKNFI